MRFILFTALLVTLLAVCLAKFDVSKLSPEETKNYLTIGESYEESKLTPKAADFIARYAKYVKAERDVARGMELIIANNKDEVESDSVEGEEAINIELILNTAQKVWKFIQDNKAVFNANTLYGTALPKGVSGAFDLYGWKAPVTVPRTLTWKNLYGITVVKLQYTVSFIPGGKAKNAQGKVGTYLDRITVIPTDVYVAWGYTAESTVSISSVTNAGSAQSPVAAAVVDLQFTVKALNREVINHSFYVRADGYYQALQ